jgi:endonuclease-3
VTGGTYTLVVRLPESTTVEFGAAGERTLPAGWYAYTGSAFGPGGFARVDRHHRVATGEHDARHWHVDYLLGHPTTRIATVVRSPDAAVECAVASALAAAEDVEPVAGVGSSDCDCPTHLHGIPDRERLVRAVRAAHGDASS